MTNYRPISLLTVFKKAMHNRLTQHLHTTNIMVTEQNDFRKGISTENAAFRLTDSVFKYINQKMHVWEIFHDLAKSSNWENNEILIAKLHFYDIRGVSGDWFRSYLLIGERKLK